MQVSEGKSVAIEYTMSLENGDTVDTNAGAEPLTFVQGSNQIFKALEQPLNGLTAGDTINVVLKPEEAFGQANPEAVIETPIDQLPDETRKPGAFVQAQNPNGEPLRGQVKAVDDQKATIDFNHPLAGQDLHFDIKIISVA